MNFLRQDYVRYGLIMTGVVVVCLAVMEFTGNNKSFEHSPIFFFSMFIAPLIIWYLGIAARKKLQKGKLTFKQGLSEGFKISLVYAITTCLIFLVYYLYINPPIVNYVREMYRMTGAPNSTVIATDLTIFFVFTLIFGAVYSSILSFFLKSKGK